MRIKKRFVFIPAFFALLGLIMVYFIAPSDAAGAQKTYIDKTRIAEGKFDMLYHMDRDTAQGGCYIEDGLFVFCYCSNDSDDLILRCFDINTLEFVWEKTINDGAHGNAICFRPKDRKLYIADCFSFDSREVLKNTVSVVDYDNIEAGITEVIVPPARGEIYSIAYDRETDTFYSTNYRGSKEGDANVLFSYEGIFEEVKDEVSLDDFTVRFSPTHSSQGVQCVSDGIAYIPYYAPQPIIAGYDLFTGELLFAEKIPRSINGKKNGEIESVMYSYDDKTITVLTTTSLLSYDGITSAEHVFNAAYRYIEQNYGLFP